MMQISGETPFQISAAHSFAISPASVSYTLSYSVDCVGWTNYSEATPAGEVLMVNGVPKNMYFKLVGNTGEVTINY